MIRLPANPLQPELSFALSELQEKINSEPAFLEKTKKAQSLWDSKGGKKGKTAFKEIFNILYNMCVATGVCNYCEQSEASDIEHIHPKSFFPEKTFEWENYVLACKQCNSGFKLDKCYVIGDGDNIMPVPRGIEPAFKNVAFINPRNEEPHNFMLLNSETYTFEILPDLSFRDNNKAEKTIEILALNDRDALIVARKNAARHYYDVLERLQRLLSVSTKNELQNLLSPEDDRFDFNKSLDDLKAEIKGSYRNYIQSHQHPSVWKMIKIVQSVFNEKWKTLFQEFPEALHW